jgi:hypothetical protein
MDLGRRFETEVWRVLEQAGGMRPKGWVRVHRRDLYQLLRVVPEI